MYFAVLNPPSQGKKKKKRGASSSSRRARKTAKGGQNMAARKRRTAAQTRWARCMKQCGGDATKAGRMYRSKSKNPWVKGYRRRKKKSAARGGGVTKKKVTKVQPSWRSKKMTRHKTGKKKGQYKSVSKRKQRRPSRMPKRIAKTRWAANQPMMMNPMTYNKPKRRRKARRKNPPGLAGVIAPVREVFEPKTLITAAWGAGGAFGALSLPSLVGQVLPGNLRTQFEKVNTGIGGVLLTAVSAGLVTGLAGLIPQGRKRQKEILAGGMIATVIRAGVEFLPDIFPLTIAAKPVRLSATGTADYDTGMEYYSSDTYGGEGVGMVPQTGMNDWETGGAMQGVGDYDTGMEGMGDYDTGMEAYADPEMYAVPSM